MSSPYHNPTPEPVKIEWARLIPGARPAFRGRKKGPGAAQVWDITEEEIPVFAIDSQPLCKSPLDVLLPAPLQKETALRWLRCLSSDFSLVALNWLLMGALLVPLRNLFPQVRTFAYDAGAPGALLGLALLNAAVITLLAYSEGSYDGSGELRQQAKVIGKSTFWATTLLILTYRLQGASWATGSLFCCVAVLNFCSLWGWRWRALRRQHCGSPTSSHLRNVLIVGSGKVGQRVARHLEGHPEAGRAVLGFLDDERPHGNGVVGRARDLARIARTGFVDEIILSPPHDRTITARILREARLLRLNVEIIPELFGCKPHDGEVERLANLPLICLHAEQLPWASLVLKRVVDAGGAAFALLILSPLLALIAGLIKLDSSGPVLYCASRAGRKGKQFRCYKFRTMVVEADALKNGLRQHNQRSGPFFKMVNDPRVTRLGRFLRRYSLDELPQLWNVLRGDMSLVGPRPHPLDDLAAYQIEHLARLDMTPGITGLWQVTARCDPSFQRGMELDRQYIRTWSLSSDLRIMLQTLMVIARGSGE
jgi:exopolysaccharide biosynthesis polyprenyl glycosylphosphotransferase